MIRDNSATALFLALTVLTALALGSATALQITDNDSTQAWVAVGTLTGALVGQFAAKPGPPPPN